MREQGRSRGIPARLQDVPAARDLAGGPYFRSAHGRVSCRKPQLDVIRKEAWPFYRTSSGVRLCWELENPKGPKGASSSSARASDPPIPGSAAGCSLRVCVSVLGSRVKGVGFRV